MTDTIEYLQGVEPGIRGGEPHSQVFYATHTFNTSTNQWERKTYMDRSFISFSFGGKWIEDFDLIAVTDGDRMQKIAYAGFEDLTTEYDVVDGQYYWGTHMLANQINFSLFTDGISQRKLDEFKRWFRPGRTEYLILAEHPNRQIKARVSTPPAISVLPFEDKVDFNFGQNNFFKRKTSTTLYKGSIALNFVMDEPYWEAIDTILDKNIMSENSSLYSWKDANDEYVLASGSKDAIKIILEDGTPITNMLVNDNILFGKRYRVDSEKSISKDGAHVIPPPDLMAKIGFAFIGVGQDSLINNLGYGVKQENTGFILNTNEPCYFYYPGNAPCHTIISFVVDASAFNNNNKIILTMKDNGEHSNILKTFIVDKPSVLIALEKAKQINSSSLNSIEKYRQVRDTVNHKRIRALYISKHNNFNSLLINQMTFTFNSKTGEATVEYILNGENVIEKAGDCVKSDYLIIEDTDYFDESGLVQEKNCHMLTSNVNLTNFMMDYTPMYL